MSSKKPNNPKTKKHHYLRTPLAAFFGVLAVVLILAAIFMVWLNRTLTDTPTFTKTVTPILQKTEVQEFVAKKGADSIVSSAPVNELAATLLKPDQVRGKNADQIRSLVNSALQTQILSIIQRPVFISTWQNNIESAHAQTIAALQSDSKDITIDLSPIVQQAVQQLQSTDLGGEAKQLKIDPKEAKITLKRDQLGPVARAYNSLQDSMLVLLLGALIASILCVVLSVHHMKTLRRVLMGVGIVSLLIFALLNLPNVVQTHNIDPVDQAAVVAIANSLFANLKTSLLVIGVGCIAAALVSKFLSRKKVTPKQT